MREWRSTLSEYLVCSVDCYGMSFIREEGRRKAEDETVVAVVVDSVTSTVIRLCQCDNSDKVDNKVLHGNRNGKIPRDYHGKNAAMVIRTKLITTVTAGMGTVRAVIRLGRESNFFTDEYRQQRLKSETVDGLLLCMDWRSRPSLTVC